MSRFVSKSLFLKCYLQGVFTLRFPSYTVISRSRGDTVVTQRVTKRRVWSAPYCPPPNIFLFKKNKCRPSCPSRPNALNSMCYAERLAVQCRPSRPRAGQGVGRRWFGACSRAFTRPFMQLASSAHGTLVGGCRDRLRLAGDSRRTARVGGGGGRHRCAVHVRSHRSP